MSKQRTFLRSILMLLGSIALLALNPALVQGQTFVLEWGSFGSGNGQFNQPASVAVDAAGDVYVAEFVGLNSRLQKFDSSGNFIAVLATGGSADGQLSGAKGTVVDAAGNIYVVDSGNSRIQKFDSNGNFLLKWGSFGNGQGQFDNAQYIDLDSAGNVYVADAFNHRVQKFDSNGVFLAQWGQGTLNLPVGLAIDAADNVYVYSINSVLVHKFNSNGTLLLQWSSRGDDIAVDAAGDVYVTDSVDHRVRKFDGNGNLLWNFGSLGSGPGQFNQPIGIDVDASGNIYITDFSNHRVQKLSQITTYAITASAGANGGIAPPGVTNVNAGANQSYTITPAAGYHIDDVLVDGGSVGAVSTYDFLNVQADHTIDASFALTNVTVSVPTVTATYNEVLTIPVSLSEASGIVSAEVFVEYDTALLTVFSAPQSPTSSAGTLTDGWTVQTNTEPGAGSLETLKIAVATDENAVTGAQTLIKVNFTVNDVRVPAASPLTLTHVLLNNGNPPNIKVNGLVTLVGTDGTIDSSPAQIVPRQDITVTVVDADADLDGLANTDQVTVTLANSPSGDSEILTLAEDATTAGTFIGTINTVFSSAYTAGDGLIQTQTGDGLLFTYSDALDAAGTGPNDRTDQTDVFGGTDGSVEISIASQPGDDVHIKVVDADVSTPPLGYLAASSTIDVDVVNGTSAQTETVTLTETVALSGIFVGTLATTSGTVSGEMTSAEDDLLTVTYVDDLTGVGAPQVDRTDDDQVLNPWGDADDNEQLQAFDAALTLLEVLFPATLNGLEELAANVDSDPVGTGINPFDASLILQHRVGIISSFPVQAATSTNHPQPNPGSPKGIPQVRSLALRTNNGYLSVWAEERDEILSGDLLLEGVEGQVVMSDELGDFLLASQSIDDGLRIVFAGAGAVSGPGELLRIHGVGSGNVHLTRALFNNGSIEGQTTFERASRAPVAFALHANAPNPFNPETTIGFELASSTGVRLEVFDLLGQKVRTLVAQTLPAGSHQALWDGRNDAGIQVGSGVYVYRLEAGAFAQTRRMMLVK